jgi:amidase
MDEHGTSYPSTTVLDPSSAPVIRIASGDLLTVSTPSVLTRRRPPQSFEELAIPVVGPIGIQGASAGQTLAVELLRIDLRSRGALVALPGLGVFGDHVRTPTTRTVTVDDDFCDVDLGVRLPTHPMVGKLGVVVPNERVASSTVGVHGGNMDCRLLGTGATVLLPVLVDEGMLHIGDVHATQGDGECLGTAVETEATVTVKIRTHDFAIEVPTVVMDGSIATIGTGNTVDEAARGALRAMVNLLAGANGWSEIEAAMVVSSCCDLGICQMVNPRASVHARVPRHLAEGFAELMTS